LEKFGQDTAIPAYKDNFTKQSGFWIIKYRVFLCRCVFGDDKDRITCIATKMAPLMFSKMMPEFNGIIICQKAVFPMR